MYTSGTLFDSRYLLKERLGRGSFGEVWLATDQQVGVDFAIKIYVAMNTQGLEQFRTEYQLSCNLINSNLLHINHMGICQQDSCPYLVMPYCPRGTASMIGKVDELTLWKFIHDVANGLAYLHSQNPPIIHQDIKPDNILQTQSGDFVITDFGISKQMRATQLSTNNNTSGAVAYMGPERFDGTYQVIKASDIWSLGATIYELATGQLPFGGHGGAMLNSGAVIPNLPNQFSSEINNVMHSCLEKDTWNRPSAVDLVQMAENYLKKQPISQKLKTENNVNTSNSNNNSYSKIIIFIALAAIGYFAYDKYSPANDNSTVESSINTDSKENAKAPTDSKNETKPVTPIIRNGSLKLSYAVWKGGIKEGKPYGKGILTFTQPYDLQGHDIQPGDTVEGECENGKLSGYCKWISSDGTEKSILLGE